MAGQFLQVLHAQHAHLDLGPLAVIASPIRHIVLGDAAQLRYRHHLGALTVHHLRQRLGAAVQFVEFGKLGGNALMHIGIANQMADVGYRILNPERALQVPQSVLRLRLQKLLLLLTKVG